MKTAFITFMLSAIVFKSFCHGSPMSISHEKFKREVENEVSELTRPVLIAAQNLRQQVAFYQNKHDKAVSESSVSQFSINTEACQNLSDTLVSAGRLAYDAGEQVYNMTLNVTDTLADLTNCIGWNPIDSAKCYVNSISNVINNVRSIKPTIVSTFTKILAMSARLEPEFKACIGMGITTTTEPPTTNVQTTQSTERSVAIERSTTARSGWWFW